MLLSINIYFYSAKGSFRVAICECNCYSLLYIAKGSLGLQLNYWLNYIYVIALAFSEFFKGWGRGMGGDCLGNLVCQESVCVWRPAAKSSADQISSSSAT